MFLDQNLYFDWCVVWFGSKNKHDKRHMFKKIQELCLEIRLTNSTLNSKHIWGEPMYVA